MADARQLIEDNLDLCVSTRALRFASADGPLSCHALLVCRSALAASVAARRMLGFDGRAKFSRDPALDHGLSRSGASIEVDLAAFLPNKHRCFQFLRTFLVDFATQCTLEGGDRGKDPHACILLNLHHFCAEEGISALISLLGKNLFPFRAVLHVDSIAAVPPALLSRCATVHASPSVEQVRRLAARLFPGEDSIAARCFHDVQVMASLSVAAGSLASTSSCALREIEAFATSAATPLARKTSLESVAARAARLCKRAAGAPRWWMPAAAVAKAAELASDAAARDAANIFAHADHQISISSNATFHSIVGLVRYWFLMQIFQLTCKNQKTKTAKHGRAKAAVGTGLLEHDS